MSFEIRRFPTLRGCAIILGFLPLASSAQDNAWVTSPLAGEITAELSHETNGQVSIQLPATTADTTYLKSLQLGEAITYKLSPDHTGAQGIFIAPNSDQTAPHAALSSSEEEGLVFEWRKAESGETLRWQLRPQDEADTHLHLVSQRFTAYFYTSSDGLNWRPEMAVDLPTEAEASGGLRIVSSEAATVTSEFLGSDKAFFAEATIETGEGETSVAFASPAGTLAGTYEVYVQSSLDEDVVLDASIASSTGESVSLGMVELAGDGVWEFAGQADLAEGLSIVLDGEGAKSVSVRILGTGWDDEDGDGMPDVWEEMNGLNPALNDAVADSDGDGIPNILELFEGTDPHTAPTTNAAANVVFVDPDKGSDYFDGWRRLRVAGRSLGPKKTFGGATKALGGASGTIHIKGGKTVHDIKVIGPGITIVPDGDVIIGSGSLE